MNERKKSYFNLEINHYFYKFNVILFQIYRKIGCNYFEIKFWIVKLLIGKNRSETNKREYEIRVERKTNSFFFCLDDWRNSIYVHKMCKRN